MKEYMGDEARRDYTHLCVCEYLSSLSVLTKAFTSARDHELIANSCPSRALFPEYLSGALLTQCWLAAAQVLQAWYDTQFNQSPQVGSQKLTPRCRASSEEAEGGRGPEEGGGGVQAQDSQGSQGPRLQEGHPRPGRLPHRGRWLRRRGHPDRHRMSVPHDPVLPRTRLDPPAPCRRPNTTSTSSWLTTIVWTTETRRRNRASLWPSRPLRG
jgi:hypothetical protein